MQRARVDLPLPDSPTTPRVSPRLDGDVDLVERGQDRRLPLPQLVDERALVGEALGQAGDAPAAASALMRRSDERTRRTVLARSASRATGIESHSGAA